MLLGLLSSDEGSQQQAEYVDEQLGAAGVDQVMPTCSMVSNGIREVSAVQYAEYLAAKIADTPRRAGSRQGAISRSVLTAIAHHPDPGANYEDGIVYQVNASTDSGILYSRYWILLRKKTSKI